MICVVENGIIVNLLATDRVQSENERPWHEWNTLWSEYTEVEPLEYARVRYLCAAGAEFASRRDAVRWVTINGTQYGFDCTVEDVTNFMAAYTPLLVAGTGSVAYKVWTGENTKAVVNFGYADMAAVYATVRASQLGAYAWYENTKALLAAATSKEELEEIFPLNEVET